MITIECKGMTEVTVFSMDGRLLKHLFADGQCRIDGLDKGVYLLRIATVNKVFGTRLVKF